MKQLEIADGGMELLQRMADGEGVTPQEYLHALINYGWSMIRRPGSWEANVPFAFRNYDQREPHEDAHGLRGCADRWFEETT